MPGIKIITVPLILVLLLGAGGCSRDFMEVTPNGMLDESVLANYEGVGALLIGAYYVIGLYPGFSDPQYALKAIKFERKLELGQEGHRYYDLQRWDDVVVELNRILEFEKSNPWGPSHYGSAVVGLEDVNFPIPQRQIDISHGGLVQNR